MSAIQSAELGEWMEPWLSGGWLMWPLLFLALLIFFSGFQLYYLLRENDLLRRKVHRMSDTQIANQLKDKSSDVAKLVHLDAMSPIEVKRHFGEVMNEYLPQINRRIAFVACLIPAGPLTGLLGTVTGMLTTFNGMVIGEGDKFDRVAQGISEALITTQTGLVISIPALILLSGVIHQRNLLRHSLARLEKYNTTMILKIHCPIPSRFRKSEVTR